MARRDDLSASHALGVHKAPVAFVYTCIENFNPQRQRVAVVIVFLVLGLKGCGSPVDALDAFSIEIVRHGRGCGVVDQRQADIIPIDAVS